MLIRAYDAVWDCFDNEVPDSFLAAFLAVVAILVGDPLRICIGNFPCRRILVEGSKLTRTGQALLTAMAPSEPTATTTTKVMVIKQYVCYS